MIERREQHGDHSGRASTTFADPSSNTNRISMLVCCNSSGTEMLRPVISGPYELDHSGSDCRYQQNEDTCITDDLFGEWLAGLNEDMSMAGRRILLLLSRDRIRSLRSAPRLSNVNLLFFPKDFPTQLRPLRGDVFHCVKMTHRIRYVQSVRSADGEWGPEAIVESLARAWTEVPRELVVSSFQRTKFREDESFLRIECPDWDGFGTGVSFRRFVTFDDDLSDTSASIPEDLKLSVRNEHQYNLRRSRRDNADLVVIDAPPRERNAAKRSADRETGNRAVAASNGHRGSSGSRKKLKMGQDVIPGAREGAKQESRASRNSKSLSFTETGDRSLVERIEDFLQGVADPTVEEDGPASDLPIGRSGEEKNAENVNNLITEMCQRSDKTRGLIERCLRTMTVGNGGNVLIDSAEEADSVPEDTERNKASRTRREDEPSRSSSREAGTSGEDPATVEDTSGCEITPIDGEFEDGDDEIPIAGRLTLKIIEAIECCEEIERSNAVDMRSLQAGDTDDEARTAKRTRDTKDDDNDDNDGPAKKRSRADESWSKRYEKNFVFGPEVRYSSSQSVESSLDEMPVHSHGPITKSKKTQTRGGELEKRCIFTLDGNSPGVSYPKD